MFTEQQFCQLAELLRTNKGLVEIADLMGLSYNTFKLYLANSDKRIERILVDKSSQVGGSPSDKDLSKVASHHAN